MSDHLELSLQDCFPCLWLREVMWLCYTAWAISLHGTVHSLMPQNWYQEGISHPPQGAQQIVHQKQKPPCSRNPVNYIQVFFYTASLGSNIGISKGTFLWKRLNPLEGLWSRISRLPLALEGCWYQPQVFFQILHSPGGDRSGLCSSAALQKHFHFSNKTFKVCMLLKHTFKFQPPSLISPITLSVLPQQEKKNPTKTKTPLSIS